MQNLLRGRLQYKNEHNQAYCQMQMIQINPNLLSDYYRCNFVPSDAAHRACEYIGCTFLLYSTQFCRSSEKNKTKWAEDPFFSEGHLNKYQTTIITKRQNMSYFSVLKYVFWPQVKYMTNKWQNISNIHTNQKVDCTSHRFPINLSDLHAVPVKRWRTSLTLMQETRVCL